MAVSVQSFFVIEESLTDKLNASWRRAVAPILNRIQRAVAQQNFTEAYELVDLITMSGISAKNDKFIKLAGMSSVLFGSSQITAPRQSNFVENGQPEEVENSTELMEQNLATASTRIVRDRARKLIAEEEELQREISQEVQKAASATFTQKFVSFVNKEGEAQINIASSLHTSRLAQFGFLTEAEFTGVTAYEVSEQLDSRTCPVCREMDGKIFPVNSAKAKVDRQLSVDDPQDLKSIAPWPRQDASSVQKLSEMSTGELIDAGFDTPPYHPRCRGVLVATTVTPDIQIPIPAPPPQFNLSQLRAIVEDVGVVDAAQIISENAEEVLTPQQLASLLGLRGNDVI